MDKYVCKSKPLTIVSATLPLEELAKQIAKRGNRLEVMNGKVYEVSRKLICELKTE